MNYSTWMTTLYQNTAQSNTLLQNICFPATHDSGTYDLQNELTDDQDPAMAAMVNFIYQEANKISSYPILSTIIPNPLEWICDNIYSTILGLSQTTTQTIAQQLAAGIRCLDLRVKYNSADGCFYTFHGLLGSNMTEILGDIQSFLQSTSGEIVVVNMGHFLDFPGDSVTEYANFENLVTSYLGDYAYSYEGFYEPVLQQYEIKNDFLQQSYQAIVTANGTQAPKSAVILIFCCQPLTYVPSSKMFWPIGYSAPDNGSNTPPLAGYYTDTNDLSVMLPAQQSNWNSALTGNLPFALYMTLTADTANIESIIAGSLAKSVAELAAANILNTPVFATLGIIAAGLEGFNSLLPWTTIQELSAPIQSDLTNLVENNFIVNGPIMNNNLSFLYIDFFEDTNVVDISIMLSANNGAEVQYLTMFGENSNTYIVQQLLPGGQMGGQVYSDGWENRYASLLPFQAGGVNYMYGFAPNADPDNFWFIQELMADGSMGPTQTASGNFHNNYAIQTTYTVNGNTFLFGMNTDDNYQFTQQLLPGGQMAINQAQGGQWENGPYWPVVTYEDANGSTYMFGCNPDTSYWFMQEVYDDGTMAPNETANGYLGGGTYTSAVTFNINGMSYIFCFNYGDKSWFIQQLSAGNFVGDPTQSGTWENAYSSFVVYESMGEVFLFGFCQANNYWFIQQIMPGGTFAPNQSSGGFWNNPYGCFGVYNPNANQSSAQARRKSLNVADEVR